MPDSDPGAKARAELDDDKREKALVTILFSDVVGSTSYYEKYGDTAGMALVDRHTFIASRTFPEYDGAILKTIGDGVMAVFTDAAKAVRAAVDMQRSMMLLNEHLPQRERLQLRIGINQGIAFRRGEDVFGDAVNFAARITKISVPGQVIISQGVFEAVCKQPDLVCQPLGDPEVKGKANRELLYEVIYTDPESYKVLRAQVTQAIRQGDLIERPDKSAAEKVFAAAAAGAAAAPAPAISENATVSHYKLLERIGSGGMGTVYRAEDTNIGRKVAVKFLDRKLMLADEAAVERFRREARTASALNHPNICRIYEINEQQGMHYIVMELLEGQTLRQMMQKQRLPLLRLLEVAIDVSSALAAAHYQDIVHRDIKPENIFITGRGTAKLLDFGLAKLNPLRPWPAGGGDADTAEAADRQLTSVGTSLGTVPCMSPEQARGEDLDHRTDIFSLGTVLYEMATGLQPFRGSTPAVVFDGILNRAPTPITQIAPEMPPPLQNVIAKALEKDRELRYQSTAQLAADLKILRRDAGIAAEAPVMPVRAVTQAAAKVTRPVAAAPAAAAPSGLRQLTSNLYVRIGAGAAVIAAAVLGFLALTSPDQTPPKPQPPLVATQPAAVVLPPPKAPEPERRADDETLKLLAVADAAEAQGDFATSLAAQEQFLRDRSENHIARNHYARTLAHTKRFSEAMTQYRMVLAAAPDDLDALIGAAKVTSWQGDLEGALRRFDEVLAAHPHNYDAEVGKAFTLMWMRRTVEAREAFRHLAEKNPADAEVANALTGLAE